jgi:4-hydroxybenzoyl-CoA reductase subunit beta
MLRLPPFKLLRPRKLAEAAAMLADEGAAAGRAVRLVAGGTDLWPNMKRRHQKAATVVSLMGIPGLAGIGNGRHHAGAGDEAGGEVRLGATTLLDDVACSPLVAARYPALATAVASISSPPLRNMGTIGGNVCVDTRCTYYNQTEEWRRAIDYCMKEEGTICWVATSSPRCWAHSASDTAPMLCALGARVRLVSRQEEREVAVEALYRDDGIDYLAKRPDEIVAEILLPAGAGAARCRSAFWKLRRRGSIDFAVLSVGAALWFDGDEEGRTGRPGGANGGADRTGAGPRARGESLAGRVVSQARIYLGAVGSYPLPAAAAADCLVGRPLSAETIAEAARLARRVATPMDNTDFQAQWRSVMVGRYAEAALREIAGLAPERLPPRHPVHAAR